MLRSLLTFLPAGAGSIIKGVKRRLQLWVIPLAILFAALLFVILLVTLWSLRVDPVASATQGETPAMTVIPAPTSTPPGMNSLFFTPTPTLGNPVIGGSGSDGIRVGVYVQVSGTDGEGLRLRTDAGTSSQVRFLALDAEVFKVIDGPREADGYVWWNLEAPYDVTRSGWAAANFLNLVETDP